MVKFYDGKAWVKVSSALFEGFIGADSLQAIIDNSVESEPPAALKLKVSKIPNHLMSRVLGTIREFHEVELALQLYYSVKDDAWDIYCPKQDASRGSVKFEDNKELDEYNASLGYYRVGTIHTHPNMSAFWSGTDMHDQKGFPGIHIVLGTDSQGIVTSTKATLFMPYGYRDIDFNELVEPISFTEEHEPDACWLLKLQVCLSDSRRERQLEMEQRSICKASNQSPIKIEQIDLYDEEPAWLPVSVYDKKLRKYGRGAGTAIAEFASYVWGKIAGYL